MKTTFLIGNGFDLNLGFRTKYSDFFNAYLSKNMEHPTPGIERFRKGLIGSPAYWSDLELALGRFSENFDDETEYIEVLEHIQDELSLYFKNLDLKIIIDNDERIKAINYLANFDEYFTEKDRRDFLDFKHRNDMSSNEICIISFNYTSSIETIYDWRGRFQHFKSSSLSVQNSNIPCKLYTIEHVHGTFENNMLLGVNDQTQITNTRFQNSKQIIRSIVKPEMNINTESLRETRCVKMINTANVICIFGMSLGETDKFWWEKIGEHLLISDSKLVIFAIHEALPPLRAYKTINIKEEIQDKFLSYLSCTDEDKERIRQRIIVCLNSSMFKITPISKHDELLKSAAVFSKQLEKINQQIPNRRIR